MKNFKRKIAPVLVLPMLWIGGMALPAKADGTIVIFAYRVDATAHLKKLNQTATVPPGTFKGYIDFGTGALRGSIKLPPAAIQMKLAGIVPLVTATVSIVQTKLVTGTVDFLATPFQATATSTFNILITSVYVATAKSVNLVGKNCTTATPVSVTMTGPANIGGTSTFSGVFTVPKLKTCGLLTTALNQVIPGPGNTFTAVASPLNQPAS